MENNAVTSVQEKNNPSTNQASESIIQTQKARILPAIIGSIIYGVLFGAVIFVDTLSIFFFGLGCGGSCNLLIFLLILYSVSLLILYLLASIHFKELKKLLPYNKSTLLLWIIVSWIWGVLIDQMVNLILFKQTIPIYSPIDVYNLVF